MCKGLEWVFMWPYVSWCSFLNVSLNAFQNLHNIIIHRIPKERMIAEKILNEKLKHLDLLSRFRRLP